MIEDINNNKKKIAVLLCTYNGEKYLEEQLESILNQENVAVSIFIRDDGSEDHTIEIVNKYSRTFPNISYVDCGKHLGPGHGFLKMLKYVVRKYPAYDYYAFADQDDIWMQDKLIAAVNMIGEDGKPVLYCSNQYIYKNGEVTKIRFQKDPDLSLEGHISKNYLSGCTMILNHALARTVSNAPYPSKQLLKYRLHDSMVFLIALCTGKVVYDRTPHIYYRIHENNTVGLKKITRKERIRKLINQDAKNLRKNTASYLITNYNIEDDKTYKFLIDFRNYHNDSHSFRRILKNKNITNLSGENRIIFKLKLLLNYI